MKHSKSLYACTVLSVAFLALAYPCSANANENSQPYYHAAQDLQNLSYLHETYRIDFNDPTNSFLLLSGWSHTEQTHTWASGLRAEIAFFTFQPNVDKLVELWCSPFNKLTDQSMAIYLNGEFIKTIELRRGVHRYRFTLPSKYQKKYRNILQFAFKECAAPADHGKSSDTRKLAVAFYTMCLRSSGTNLDQSEKSRELKTEGNNILLPANSIISRKFLLKPKTALQIESRTLSEKYKRTIKVVAISDSGREKSISQLVTRDLSKASLDLSDFGGEIVEIRIANETTTDLGKSPNEDVWIQISLGQLSEQEDVGNSLAPPNILFIVIDTLRADYLGCYGGPCHTPNIDSLAANGTLFARAYSHIPITLPAHATMFCSDYPSNTLVLNNGQSVSYKALNIAELLSGLGFQTVGIVSIGSLNQNTHIDRGFQRYWDVEDTETWLKTADIIDDEVQKYTAVLLASPRWFAFVHYSDPHAPYHNHARNDDNVTISLNGERLDEISVRPDGIRTVTVDLREGINLLQFEPKHDFLIHSIDPGEGISWHVKSGDMIKADRGWHCLGELTIEIKATRGEDSSRPPKFSLSFQSVREDYEAEVEFVDGMLGKMLAGLKAKGLLDNTLIILTADHGEGLGDHNLIGHVEQLYDTLTHVPLIISYPKSIPKGKRIPYTVRHIDITPTILEYSGLTSSEFKGRSLRQMIEGNENSDRPVMSMTFNPEAEHNLVSLVKDGFKIIKNVQDDSLELYNLAKDPKELNDISMKNVFKLNRMERALEKCMDSEGYAESFDPSAAKTIPMNEEQIEKLRGLGYVK